MSGEKGLTRAHMRASAREIVAFGASSKKGPCMCLRENIDVIGQRRLLPAGRFAELTTTGTGTSPAIE